LWSGILAGPIAWAFDLGVSYALANTNWICNTQRKDVLFWVMLVSIAIVAAGAVVSWNALRRTTKDEPTDGGAPRQRARFMALLGLASSALFAVTIVASAIPPWILDACQ